MVKKQSVRFRLVAYPLLAIFFSILAYFVATSAMGYTFKLENGKLEYEKTGSIILSSRPGDAIVFLNGNRYASKTPYFSFLTLQLPRLREGEYRLRLEKEGYEAWEGVFDVYSGLVTWGTHILMLPNDKKIDSYSYSAPVKNVLVSPDHTRELIELYDETNNVITVYQVSTLGKQSTKLFEKRLAAGEMYRPLTYSYDNQRILFERQVDEVKNYLVFEARESGSSWDLTATFKTAYDAYYFNPKNHDELYGLKSGDLFLVKYVDQNQSGVIFSQVVGLYFEDQNIIFTQKENEKINLYRLESGNRKNVLIKDLPKDESYIVKYLTSSYGYAVVPGATKDLLLYPSNNPNAKPKKLATDVTAVLPSPEFEFLGYLSGGDFKCYQLDYARTYTALSGRKLSSIAWFEDEFNLAYIENGKLKMVTYNGSYDKEIADAENGFPVALSTQDPIIYFVAKTNDQDGNDLFVFDFKLKN